MTEKRIAVTGKSARPVSKPPRRAPATNTHLTRFTSSSSSSPGASGVLGRAIIAHLSLTSTPYLPLSHTRTSPSPLYPHLPSPTPLDLLNPELTRSFFVRLQSDPNTRITHLIHCAAERRPDVAESDPERASELNVGVTKRLAVLAKELGFGLVYISTDYVFDGSKPPYEVDDETNPLNLYGRLKRDGEREVLSVRRGMDGDEEGMKGKELVVLRVPLLYGRTEYNSETAVNVFVDILEDQSGKEYTMDHFATRFPTCVEDVARVIWDLLNLPTLLPPILHYSSSQGLTKYSQLLIISHLLSLPSNHVKPDAQDPATKPNPSGVKRPGNTQLGCEGLRRLGVDVGETRSGGFEGWWRRFAEERRKGEEVGRG